MVGVTREEVKSSPLLCCFNSRRQPGGNFKGRGKKAAGEKNLPFLLTVNSNRDTEIMGQISCVYMKLREEKKDSIFYAIYFP